MTICTSPFLLAWVMSLLFPQDGMTKYLFLLLYIVSICLMYYPIGINFRILLDLRKNKTTDVDTIIEIRENLMIGAPNRNYLRQVQTPQGFKRVVLSQAYENALNDPHFTATDDCGVVFKYLPDTHIKIVEGNTCNIKITYKEDLEFLEKQINTRVH